MQGREEVNASRSFTHEVARRAPRNRQREREDFTVQPSARKPNTRAVYSEPLVEKAEPAIRVLDTARVVGIVDQYDPTRGFGFVVIPSLDCEVLFFHVRDCNFDQSLMTPGLSIEVTPVESTREASGRTSRRVANHITVAEPLTSEMTLTVARTDERGNGWLAVESDMSGRFIYFRTNRLDVKPGHRVTALVYDAPRGKRASRVERI